MKTIIDPSSTIGEHVHLGQGCVVGPNVHIEEHVIVGPFTVIEENVHIEKNSAIGAYCQIRFNAHIKSNSKISARTVIGSEGFGYAQNERHESYFIPQLGGTSIGPNTFIGTLTAIDRGAFKNTVLGPQSFLGAFSHIAHNLNIQRHFNAKDRFVVAGSTEIGPNVSFKEKASVTGHIKISQDSQIGFYTRATRAIKKPSNLTGTPPMDNDKFQLMFESLKNISKDYEKIKGMIDHEN